MTLLKCFTQYTTKFRKLRNGHRTGNVSFHSNPKIGSPKQCSNYHTIALISYASKAMLKILKARLQQYVNQEYLDVQAGFRKCRGTRGQIANTHWIKKKQEHSRKMSTSASSTTLKTLTEWITTNSGKFLKRWKHQITLPASWETCMQVKKQQLELDIEQQTGSKLERSTSRLYIITLLI